MTRPDAVIFDLDGTLIDSVPDIAAAVNAYLEDAGWPTQDNEVIGRLIGRGARALLKDIFMLIGHPADMAALDRAQSVYLANYAAEPASRTQLFPHVRDDLIALVQAGSRLGICTNKPHNLTLRVLEELNLSNLFDTVIGADLLPYCKPDPRHLLEVVRRMQVTEQAWIYVGDTEVDIKTAEAAGAIFRAVPWGGGGELELLDSQRLTRLSDLFKIEETGLGVHPA
ncbi:MAG: HAD-IA family hydrolase [Rhodobacteraceae bacterium]|nr:HAD-IA family hydrolase [Paracoccaceae bacterium]